MLIGLGRPAVLCLPDGVMVYDVGKLSPIWPLILKRANANKFPQAKAAILALAGCGYPPQNLMRSLSLDQRFGRHTAPSSFPSPA
jgi:hypothetical protein